MRMDSGGKIAKLALELDLRLQQTIEIHVWFLPVLREATGHEEIRMTLTADATIEDLSRDLVEKFSKLKPRSKLEFIVNGRIRPIKYILKDKQRVVVQRQ